MRNLFLIFLLIPFCAFAQESSLTVSGTGSDLYLTHKAAAHENFYSIGRLYNISPKEIAPYNNIVLEKGLSIGQAIKIPLKTELNFSQSGAPAGDEAAVPLYHTVLAGENLFQISNRYMNVPVSSLKAWNKLTGDAVAPGKKMIVGYLRVKKGLSSLAGKAVAVPVDNVEAVVKQEPLTKEIIREKIAEPEPAAKASSAEKREEGPVPVTTQAGVTKNTVEAGQFKGGFFRTSYTGIGKEENGTAGIFKSISGREDGKYYCLHNTAQQNTIVRITNKSTGKFVYAKVLDGIPDLKQNAKVTVLVSSAAADVLGAADSFECSVSY